MSINLSKGQVINLSKETTSSNFELRASWDEGMIQMDVDIMCVLCDRNRKVVQPADANFIFYNNLNSADGSVTHTGDNRTGAGEGWDEIIEIDFSKMKGAVENVQLLVNIHEGYMNGTNFGLVKNLVVEVYDTVNDKTVARYEPELDNSTDTCLVIGEFFKRDGNYYYKAVGVGHAKGLDVVLTDFGIDASF